MITLFVICSMILSSKSRSKQEIYLEDVEQLRFLQKLFDKQ